ncbi:AsmA family protein [Sinorhizobium sp. BG8]|uniref:AsmA family protein n=1 Tax=Sinorhizobium sp. BG8 TaxID=2613773 RepID=UPI00193E4183|nr:AsmA family protein [Sinorhizobium sp. BG8]QRM55915.1 AsmA family protein [Sinorhizobium sp. BG8]
MLSRFVIFFGGLVVLALFAALLAPLFVDWTNFRQNFEQEASRIMGRKVVVHGRVDARILPFPSVTLNDVRVGEEDGKPIVEVARFSMDAELAPFLSGEALIFDMRVEQPRARLKLLADGTLDWARGRAGAIPAKSVVLENVIITDGELEFIDEQTGRTRRLTDIDAKATARSLAGPWKAEGRAALDGEAGDFQLTSGQVDEHGTLSMRARIVPERLPLLADLEGELKIVDFKPRYDGTFTLAEKIAPDPKTGGAPIKVGGKFELSNERLRVPDYRLEAGNPEDPYVVTGEATLDTGKQPEFLLIADGQQIDVNRIGNKGEAGKTGRNPQLSARQRMQALLAIVADIPIPQVPGRASLALPAIVIGDTTVRDVRLDVKPDGDGWTIEKGAALLPGRTTIEASGRLTLSGARSFAGDLLLASNQPSGFAAWLAGSIDPRIRKLKTAGFSAKVDLTEELQRFENLELAVGPASMTGRIERQSVSGSTPTLSMELKGDRVELESLQALAGLIAGDASMSTVLEHAIALDLKADHFSGLGEEADGVSAALSLKEGILQIQRLDVDSLAGAQIEIGGRMGGSLLSPTGSFRMALKAGAMQPVAELLARHLPQHPVVSRFVSSAGYYDDADVEMTASVPEGGKEPLAANLTGTANGGRVELHVQASTLADLILGRSFRLNGTLENPVTTVLVGQAGMDPLPFDAEPNGLLALKITQDKAGPADVSVAFTTERTSMTANGEVQLGTDHFLAGTLAVALDSDDVEPYLMMNGVALPQSGAGLPLKLSAEVTIDPKELRLTGIDGKADRNGFSGDFTLDRTASAKGRGTLAFDTIDLAWLAETVLGPVEDIAQGGLNTGELGNPGWNSADVFLALTARQFWPGIYGAVDNFKTALSWHGSDIALDDIEGDWFGGKLGGRLKLVNAEANGILEARLDLAGADLSKIVWASSEGPLGTGRAELTLAVDASGKSIAAMAKSATGSGEARLNGLEVQGINTAAFPAILAAADGVKGDITKERTGAIAEREIMQGRALLGAARIPFSIASGTLRAQNISAGDGYAEFAGDVEIGLSEQRIGSKVGLRFRAGDEALAGAEPEVVLSWAGLLDAPGRSLDVQPLANFLSLRKFEIERRRVETLQANVLEKQRLRREVALYRYRARQREWIAENVRLQEIEENRRRADAKIRAARHSAEQKAAAAAAAEFAAREEEVRKLQEAEAQAKAVAERLAAEEAARQQRRQRSNAGGGEELAPANRGQSLNFDVLPGFN